MIQQDRVFPVALTYTIQQLIVVWMHAQDTQPVAIYSLI